MEKPLVTAMSGVTIACPGPDQLTDLLERICGWEVVNRGTIDDELESLWKIAKGSAGNQWVILRSPKSTRGMIRVVKGIDRERTRPIGTRWSGVEIVVMHEIDTLFDKLKDHPAFEVLSPPTTFDFSDVGANIHRGFHGKGPGKTHLMFTMEVTKPTGGYDFPSADATVGYIFSVPLVSTEYELSLEFYRDDLGMVPMLTDRLEDGLWHKVWNLPSGTVVELSILKGDAPGFGLGGVELQGYDGQHIDPVPFGFDRFDGGTCLTTYTAENLDQTFKVISESNAAQILSSPTAISQPPYDGLRAFSFMGISGERMEITEKGWAP